MQALLPEQNIQAATSSLVSSVMVGHQNHCWRNLRVHWKPGWWWVSLEACLHWRTVDFSALEGILFCLGSHYKVHFGLPSIKQNEKVSWNLNATLQRLFKTPSLRQSTSLDTGLHALMVCNSFQTCPDTVMVCVFWFVFPFFAGRLAGVSRRAGLHNLHSLY